MSYEDFIWFMLSEEDKTTARSIEYWFKLVDLDNNGIITYFIKAFIFLFLLRGFELEYFF